MKLREIFIGTYGPRSSADERFVMQRSCACGSHAIAGGGCSECRTQPGVLQRQGVSHARSEVPPVVPEVLRSPGQSLDAGTRAFMESRFGRDFSHVRVHTDAKAARSAQAVNALAYTIGRDVVFAGGQYAPQTNQGRRLIAHELAHTIQQGDALTQPRGETLTSSQDTALEREADRAAEGLSQGQGPGSMQPGPLRLQRKPATPEELAAKALTAGPKDKKGKAAFEKAEKAAAAVEKAGTPITRIEIPNTGTDAGAKGVTSSEYQSESKKCGSVKSEVGLPNAFLCTTYNIAVAEVAPDDAATFTTNVRVAFKKGKSGGGSVWVVSANLPFELNTAGFLDISAIDSKMLKPYETHELGHSTIAHQIRDRLSKLLQAELEGALPTEKKPLEESGKKWDQDGVDAIVEKITRIRERYMKWFDELATAADSDWDAQEKTTLTTIAAAIKAKTPKPGSSVPKVPGE